MAKDFVCQVEWLNLFPTGNDEPSRALLIIMKMTLCLLHARTTLRALLFSTHLTQALGKWHGRYRCFRSVGWPCG